MRLLCSFVTGAALAPIVMFLVRLLIESRESAATGRIFAVCGAGVLVTSVSWVGRRRPVLGSIGVMIAAGSAVLVPGEWTSFSAFAALVPLAVLCVGLALLGGRAPSVAPALLGAALATIGIEGLLVPMIGWSFVIPLLAVALVGVRLLSVRDADSAAERTPFVELALAGVVLGFAEHALRPFVLQHNSGSAFSHVAFGAVILFAMGAAALVPLPRGPSFRVVLAAIGVVALYVTVQTLARCSDLRQLDEVPFGADRDARVADLARLRVLLGFAAVGAGLWLKPLFSARDGSASPRIASRLATFLLTAGAGAIAADRVLADPGLFVELRQDLVRAGPREWLIGSRIESDGVLRSVSDPSLGEGAIHLLWHGRPASRGPQFKALEIEEVRLAGRLSGRGSVLLVGNALGTHREGFVESTFSGYELAPTLPALDAALVADEKHRSLARPGEGDAGLGAVVVLSSPYLSFEAARVLTDQALARFAAALAPDGVLLVWFDLRAVPLDVVGAVARALNRRHGALRAWLALDNWAGPFVALEVGPLAPLPRDGVSTLAAPIDPRVFLAFGSRTATLADPTAETHPPKPHSAKTIADPKTLRVLASAVTASGARGIGALLDALVAHSEVFRDQFAVSSEVQRDPIGDAEVDALLRALAAGTNDGSERAMVMNQVRRFLLAAYARREYERLDRILLPALEQNPDDAALHLLSGRAAFDLLDDETAIEELEVAVRGDRSQVEAFTLLGRAYARKKDFASALSALESARDLAPERTEVLRALGLTLLAAGRPADALPYLERVALEHPSDQEVQAALSNAKQ